MLGAVYHVLDGKRTPTPVDEIDPLSVPESPKVLVPATVCRTKAASDKLAGRFGGWKPPEPESLGRTLECEELSETETLH